MRNLDRRPLETVRSATRQALQPDWRNLLEQLVLQIRGGEPRDQAGHRFTMNIHYTEAARALGIETSASPALEADCEGCHTIVS